MTDDLNFATGLPSDEMAQYLQLFLDETTEQLDALVETLLALEDEPESESQLNEAFRLIHSVKGSSAMMGLDNITVLAHQLENHFERLRSRLVSLDPLTLNLILRCIDFLRECNRRLRSGESLGSAPELLEELGLLSAGGAPKSEPTVPAAPAKALPPAEIATIPAPPQVVISPEPAVPAKKLEPVERTFRVAVRFEPDLQLIELKAELVVSRLADLATIHNTDPGPHEAHRLTDIRRLQILLASGRSPADLRAAADVDGVELIEVEEGVTDFSAASSDAPAVVPMEAAPIRAAEVVITDEAEEPPAEEPVDAPEVTPHAAQEGKSKVGETVRVDIDRLDNLMNLAGELVVNKARFVQIARQMSPAFKKSSLSGRARAFGETMRRALTSMKARFESGDGDAALTAPIADQLAELELELAAIEEQANLWEESRRGFTHITEAIDQLTRVSDSLQRGVLDTRMVPVAPLFNRFKRVVRDIAQELGKKVRLEISGEKTELDKRMIDELGDPLVHLIRNSIDHGIESAELRAKRGKPDVGVISLEASHSGNNVFISVSDDGGGLNTEKIKRRVAERGLLPAALAEQLSDREALEFIWHPGFSTAEVVSGISGRGVGMDIVKTRIAELNGAIDVDSSPGRGTTFTVRLPLTLAIIRSLLFRLRHGVFAVPLDNVREIVSVPVDKIVTIHGRQTFDARGEFLPLVDIDDIFEWRGTGRTAGATENGKRVDVVILHAANRTMGLKVNELHGGQDIVIKSLAENFVHIRGLSGASILGDGSVCLLLDVGAAIDLASGARGKGTAPAVSA